MAPSRRSPDDMPLAAYGGTGMEEEAAPAEATVEAAAVSAAPESPTAAMAPVPGGADSAVGGGAPEVKLKGPGLAGLLGRLAPTLRTSRVAAGALFVVAIVIGVVLLSAGKPAPGSAAVSPTPAAGVVATAVPPSGDATLELTGAATGTYALGGLPGGQHVDTKNVSAAWADATQTGLTISGPVDRGTRLTDARLVLTITVAIGGQTVTFTSLAGECTIGMASTPKGVSGSFTCHKLKGPDHRLTIEATGTYRT